MIEVGIDCTHVVHGRIGGFENFLVNLLEGMAETLPDDVRVTLFVRADQREPFAGFETAFTLRPVPVVGKIARILWLNLVVPIWSLRYSVLLFPGNVRPYWLPRPTVTVVCDIQYMHFPELWPWYLLLHHRLFVSRSIRCSDTLVTISGTIADEVRDAFGRMDAVPIHIPTILLDEPGPDAEPDLDLGDFFLVPSSLQPHKNLSALVAAIERLAEERSDLPTFVFIGAYAAADFPAHAPLESIRVLGFVPREQKDTLLRRCRALVLPSRYEGFGLPYMEAQLVGRPVVASDMPIAREILGDSATWISPPHDTNAIVAALTRAIDGDAPLPDPAATERMRELTHPHRVARRYFEELRKLASR